MRQNRDICFSLTRSGDVLATTFSKGYKSPKIQILMLKVEVLFCYITKSILRKANFAHQDMHSESLKF